VKHWIRATALLLPLLLTACLFQPGKFTSALTINKDRSFTFTYVGEVMAVDLEGMTGDLGALAGEGAEGAEGDDAAATPAKTPAQVAQEKAAEKAAKDEQYRELAGQLAKEYGYKTVEYRGNGLFYVDYAISGTLTHGFAFPYNQDGGMIFPWVAVELRGGDTVRVKAPGFAKQDMGGMGDLGAGGGDAPSKIDGTFTLTTDAAVVSQNNEDGAKTAGGKSVIAWRVTPRTTDAPTAVLRIAPR
jgi:hypothetical protein